jgi:hypothetical protein
MRYHMLSVVAVIVTAPLAAQQNPFKLPHSNLSGVQVDYAFAGDIQGTGMRAMTRDRMVEQQHTTGKMFGKTSTTDTWMLVTPDTAYSADLVKKTGTRMPNMVPLMAHAYDDLDGSGKQRLHQNMQDMAQLIGKAFGSQALWSGEKTGTNTYAGEKCDEHTFGAFSICSMQGAPGIPLHMSGSLLCLNFEQTATAVHKGEPAATAFAPPAGITFRDAVGLQNADSLARGYVKYLASQELSDSLAKARQQMAAQAQPAAAGTDSAHRELTPAEKAQLKQSCEAMKNFDIGKAMNDATHRVVVDAVNEAAKEKQNELEQGAKNKIKNVLKRPHF